MKVPEKYEREWQQHQAKKQAEWDRQSKRNMRWIWLLGLISLVLLLWEVK